MRNVSGRLERFLLSRSELVLRVGTRLTAGTRKSARTYGKSDSIDALAVARTTLREPNLPRATHKPKLRELKLLVDHREDLVLRAEIAALVRPMAPRLLALSGVGDLIAARRLAETGGSGRFATDAQLARHAGCAPIEVSSGRMRRHRLSRMGNRKLNAALHQVALTQARVHPEARAYLEKEARRGQDHQGSVPLSQTPLGAGCLEGDAGASGDCKHDVAQPKPQGQHSKAPSQQLLRQPGLEASAEIGAR